MTLVQARCTESEACEEGGGAAKDQAGEPLPPFVVASKRVNPFHQNDVNSIAS
jgi:hypothetical protein